jgi:hypothetical protein
MDTAHKFSITGITSATGTQALTLEVVDSRTVDDHPELPVEAANNTALRLLCQVLLERPRVRSNSERRRQLRDSLIGGEASRNAGVLARDPHFWDFLQQINLMAYEGEVDTRRSRHFINRVCGVNGRYDFEHSSDAALRYFTLIEQPFLDWLLAAD